MAVVPLMGVQTLGLQTGERQMLELVVQNKNQDFSLFREV